MQEDIVLVNCSYSFCCAFKPSVVAVGLGLVKSVLFASLVRCPKSFIKNLVRAKSVLNRNRPSINRCKKTSLKTQLLRCQEVFIDLVHWLITSTALRSMRSIYFSTFSCRSSGFIGNNRARFQPPGGAVDDSQRTQRTCS